MYVHRHVPSHAMLTRAAWRRGDAILGMSIFMSVHVHGDVYTRLDTSLHASPKHMLTHMSAIRLCTCLHSYLHTCVYACLRTGEGRQAGDAGRARTNGTAGAQGHRWQVHAYRHVYRHVRKHVYRHVHRRVYRHVCSHVCRLRPSHVHALIVMH